MKQYKKYSAGALAESLSPKDQADVGQLNDSMNVDDDKTSQTSENEEEKVRGVVYAKTRSAKDSVEKACEMSFNHNLTICHVNLDSLENEDEKTEEDAAK